MVNFVKNHIFKCKSNYYENNLHNLIHEEQQDEPSRPGKGKSNDFFANTIMKYRRIADCKNLNVKYLI